MAGPSIIQAKYLCFHNFKDLVSKNHRLLLCNSQVCCHLSPVWTDVIAIWGLSSLMLFPWPWTKHQSLTTSWIWSCNVNLGEKPSPHLWVLHVDAQDGRRCLCRGVLLHTSSAPEMVLFPSLFIQDYPLRSPSPSFTDCNAVWRPDERPFQ